MKLQPLCYRWASIIMFSLMTQQVWGLYKISGQVVDSHQQPIPFANVLLLQYDSTLIKGDVTNEEGYFLIDGINEGQFRLAVSMLGYKTAYHILNVVADEPSIHLDMIQLEEEIFQLEAVEISIRKPLFVQKTDRLIINVGNSITGSGGSVMEILEKSPGVRINRQSNSILLNGKSGVMIMINGKIRQMPIDAAIQMLQGMSATQIERIELITTPPAKYDAAGSGGLINIVLKKGEDQGTNGSMSLYVGYGKYEKYGGNISFNHRSGKINLFGNYAYSFDHNFEFVDNIRTIQFNHLKTTVSSSPNWIIYKTNHQANLGLDIALNKHTILGAQVSGYADEWSNGNDAINAIRITENDLPTTTMDLYNRERRRWQHIMGNLNLLHTINQRQSLSVDLDYLHFQNNNPTDLFNEITDIPRNLVYQEQFRVRKTTPLSIWVGKIDHSLKIGERLTLESGLKGTFTQFENDIKVHQKGIEDWVANSNFTQFSTLRENVLAAYHSFQFNREEKTKLSGGLRYEFTAFKITNQGELNRRLYGNLFPTLHFSHQLSENHTIQFGYNRRINRPTFNDLASHVILLDPYTFITGNPSLQPAISSTLKADYRFKSLLFSISYTHEDSAIVTYQPRVDAENNIQIYAAQNLDYLKTWNASISLPFSFTDWWEAQNSMMLLSQHLKTGGANPPISIQQFGFSFTTMHSFKLPKNIFLELSGAYQSRSLWGYMRMEPIGSMNIGIQKKFNDNSKLQFTCTDIFDTYDWKFITDIPDQNLTSTFAVNWEGQKFRLVYSRNFGSHKVKSTRKRSTGSVEERQRVTN